VRPCTYNYSVEHAVSVQRARVGFARGGDPSRVLAFVAPFALVLYLALKRGGYDVIVYSQVGVLVGWFLLVAALSGTMVSLRHGSMRWVAIGLLCALALWTALAWTWADSWDRAAAETARVITYAGVFTTTALLARRRYLTEILSGVAAAIATVVILALGSRFAPSLFPANDTATFLPTVANRLAYPLNYWNAVAALVALAVPIAIERAAFSPRLALRAAWAAVLPLMALTIFLTFSRGGALALGVALIVLFLVSPRRLALLGPLVLGAGGGTILIAAATQRTAVEDGTVSAATQHQGTEMAIAALVVAVGVAFLQVAFTLAHSHGNVPARLIPSRRLRRRILAGAAVAALIAAIALQAPERLSDQWQSFKTPQLALPTSQENRIERFQSASGHGRYQFWEAAVDAAREKPLTGIGPGSYEFWWAKNGSLPWFVRNAHSLYMETLAELGVVGLALVLGFLAFVLAAGVQAARRVRYHAPAGAAATAALAAFATSAALDWIWQVPAVPVAFLVLAGALVSAGARARSGPARPWSRVALVVASVAATIPLVMLAASASSVRASQLDAQRGKLDAGLESAQRAADFQPSAASPRLQQALVMELQRNFAAAAVSAEAATKRDPSDWRNWLVLARIRGENGDAAGAVAAYRRARALNPRSPIFAR
jgi:hypothetical protein